jgi:hypothetical protein
VPVADDRNRDQPDRLGRRMDAFCGGHFAIEFNLRNWPNAVSAMLQEHLCCALHRYPVGHY